MKRWRRWRIRVGIAFAVCAFVAGLVAAIAYAGDPHNCKGDPHKCAASTETVTVPGQTVTLTQTVTAPQPPPASSSSSVTVTVVVPASPHDTVVKLQVKKVRRWCGRWGVKGRWRCDARKPAFVK